MSMRLSLICGMLFAAVALVATAATMLDAPRQAMNGFRARLTTCALPGLRCAPPGTFLHQRTIGPPPDPSLGLPDPTTLVSSAWVDLAAGPVRLDLPAAAARFLAVMILDDRDVVVAVADGAIGGTRALTIAGPADAIGAGTAIEPGSDWVWIVARVGVADERDIDAAHVLQDGLRLTRLPHR